MIDIKDFQPIPKRFMLWDKGLGKFLEHAGEKVYDLPLLTDLLGTYNVVEIHEDLLIIQSTNLFDKNGEEIFEGSIVESSEGAIFMVRQDRYCGKWLLKNVITGDSSNSIDGWNDRKDDGLTIIGHILSNSIIKRR